MRSATGQIEVKGTKSTTIPVDWTFELTVSGGELSFGESSSSSSQIIANVWIEFIWNDRSSDVSSSRSSTIWDGDRFSSRQMPSHVTENRVILSNAIWKLLLITSTILKMIKFSKKIYNFEKVTWKVNPRDRSSRLRTVTGRTDVNVIWTCTWIK